jgi:hypothetical protein
MQMEIDDLHCTITPTTPYTNIRVTSRHKRVFLNMTLMFSLVAVISAEKNPCLRYFLYQGLYELEIHWYRSAYGAS